MSSTFSVTADVDFYGHPQYYLANGRMGVTIFSPITGALNHPRKRNQAIVANGQFLSPEAALGQMGGQARDMFMGLLEALGWVVGDEPLVC